MGRIRRALTDENIVVEMPIPSAIAVMEMIENAGALTSMRMA